MAVIKETARVVAFEDGGVWVEAQRRQGCGDCPIPGGCGQGLMHDDMRDRAVRLWLPMTQATPSLGVGDEVCVGIDARALPRALMRFYALPFGGLLAGAVLSALAGGGDVLVALGIGCGCAGGVLAAWVLRDADHIEMPQIVEHVRPRVARKEARRSASGCNTGAVAPTRKRLITESP